MADAAGKVEDGTWPMPKFNFQVKWGKATMNFSEVSGLDAEAQIIKYRNQESKDFYPIKMPGIGKVNNVTLKRGVFVGDQNYWDWYSQVKLNSVTKGRETIQIELMNENGQRTMTWTLNNAYPTKITSTAMQSDANEAAIDTLEVAYETLVIKNENNS
jgi:phage tail-like protein